MRNSVVVCILENQNFQKQLSEKMRIRERGQYRVEQENRYAEDETDYISELRTFQKLYQELRGTSAQQRSGIEEKTDIDIWAVTDTTEETAKNMRTAPNLSGCASLVFHGHGGYRRAGDNYPERQNAACRHA